MSGRIKGRRSKRYETVRVRIEQTTAQWNFESIEWYIFEMLSVCGASTENSAVWLCLRAELYANEVFSILSHNSEFRYLFLNLSSFLECPDGEEHDNGYHSRRNLHSQKLCKFQNFKSSYFPYKEKCHLGFFTVCVPYHSATFELVCLHLGWRHYRELLHFLISLREKRERKNFDALEKIA